MRSTGWSINHVHQIVQFSRVPLQDKEVAMEEEEDNLITPTEKWYQKITVEPPLFLYMMAYMVTSVIEQAFFVYKACKVDHQYPEEICRNINNASFLDIKKEVQVTVSNFYQWNNILGHIVPIILAFYMGAWSDKRGRKIPLIMGLTGKLIYSSMIIVNSYQREFYLLISSS